MAEKNVNRQTDRQTFSYLFILKIKSGSTDTLQSFVSCHRSVQRINQRIIMSWSENSSVLILPAWCVGVFAKTFLGKFNIISAVGVRKCVNTF